MEQAEKVREIRLRRMAERQGLRLSRSKRRDVRAVDFGKYWLYRGDEVVTPAEGVGIDDIEAYLTR